jgi:N-acetylneuraminic acid mutarotase
MPVRSRTYAVAFALLLLPFATTLLQAQLFHGGGMYNVGVEPQRVVAADFNHDGKLDLATVDFTSEDVSILLGDGNGRFQPPKQFATNLDPSALVVGDFNRDGNLDLAVTEYGFNISFQLEGELAIFFGNGDGTFRPGPVYPLTQPYDITVADFNGDGFLDLAVADNGANLVRVFMGNGDGTFAPPVNRYGPAAERVLAVDLNGDGHPDLAVLAYCAAQLKTCPHGAVEVFLNDGRGSFGAPRFFRVAVGPDGVAAADLNHDGKMDLVVANNNFESPSVISVLLGRGDGTFEPAVNYNAGAGPAGVAIADLNGDGNLDVVVANVGDSTLSVFFGLGNGKFQPAQSVAFKKNTVPISVVAARFQPHRLPDLAVALDFANRLAILLNPTPPPNPNADEWTWKSGANTVNQSGNYGTLGIAAASNVPGARVSASSWADPFGDLWLFGGFGVDSTNAAQQGDLNDLWEYSRGKWTWMGGSNVKEQPGTYGTQGQSSLINVPGARFEAASWTDPLGNFWLFGGLGIDSTGTRGQLNDLWMYNGSWTWMSGANVGSQPGTYGTQGIANGANVPGARVDAATWVDSSGNLWLFGGEGYDSAGRFGILNDLWEYNPSSGEWTWMGGSNLHNQFGNYGTQGTAALTNVPGSRTNPVTWTDKAGDLWLFGGQGNDKDGVKCQQTVGPCVLNDLWEYSTSTSEWTWIGGSNVVEQPGTYGTEGTPAAGNFPGARNSAVSWTDTHGDFWLFGGFGFDSTIGPPQVFGDLNDLWKYSAGQWTWMGGSNQAGQTGTYGTRGAAAPGNVPGARESAVSWVDRSGNLWLFGGFDPFVVNSGKFNDLWQFQL